MLQLALCDALHYQQTVAVVDLHLFPQPVTRDIVQPDGIATLVHTLLGQLDGPHRLDATFDEELQPVKAINLEASRSG